MSISGAIPLILVKKEQLVEGKYPAWPSRLVFFSLSGPIVRPTADATSHCARAGCSDPKGGNDVRPPAIDPLNRDLCHGARLRRSGALIWNGKIFRNGPWNYSPREFRDGNQQFGMSGKILPIFRS